MNWFRVLPYRKFSFIIFDAFIANAHHSHSEAIYFI
jgi:hypothetical protein